MAADCIDIESDDTPGLVSLVTPYSIAMQVGAGFRELVPAGMQLPFQTTFEMVLAADRADSDMHVSLFEDGKPLSLLVFGVPQNVRSSSPVLITLTIDTERRIFAEVHFPEFNQTHHVDLKAPKSVSQPTQSQQFQEIIERSKELANQGDFWRAKNLLLWLPDDPVEILELKRDFLKQLEEAEAHSALRERVENVARDAQRLAEQGSFLQATSIIHELPDHPPELVRLKGTLLEQFADAEIQYLLYRRIETTLEELKRLAEQGQFHEARELVSQLPDQPSELVELKHHLLRQFQHAEAARDVAIRFNKFIGTLIKWPSQILRTSRQLRFHAGAPNRR